MKYFVGSCILFLLKPYFINMSELIEAIRCIQNFKIRNICTFVHKYEAISSSLINEHHVISKYFLYIYILYEYEGILKCPKFLELQYCKVELFQRRKERKIDHKIIQQSTPNTLLNIEPIHKNTQKMK